MENASNLNIGCHDVEDPLPFEHFAPTLAQCLIIVIGGYLIAKFQLLKARDLRGIGAFVNFIGMPGIICMTLSSAADLRGMRWELPLALFLGKLLVFGAVAGAVRALRGNVGVAGLLAIFCVHSNDLPVGNPLMTTLYADRPQMLKYLFMMPALTMLFFMPLGTLMLEIHKSRKAISAKASHGGPARWRQLCTSKEWSAFLQSALQAAPAVLATIAGVALNLFYDGRTPRALHRTLEVIAATVPGCVLCLLGFNMVRKERYLVTSAVVSAVPLIAVRMFVSPLVMHALTRLLAGGDSGGSKMLSDFSLMYGIVSPATAIFTAGQEYRKPLAAMSVTLIVTSFLSFPLSFAVAKVTVVPACPPAHYLPQLGLVVLGAACCSLACHLIFIFSVLWRRKVNQVPYCYVVGLVAAQMSTCCGVLLWKLSSPAHPWVGFLQTALCYGGEMSIYVCACAMAVAGIQTRFKGRCKHIGVVACLACAVFTSLMCAFVVRGDIGHAHVVGPVRSNLDYLQIVAVTILEGICLIVVGTSMLLHFGYSKKTENTFKDSREYQKIHLGFENPIFFIDSETTPTQCYKRRVRSISVLSVESDKEEADHYQQDQQGRRGEESAAGQQFGFRFFGLLVMVMFAVALKFVSNTYKLSRSELFEVMVPLEFLQAAVFTGQGVFILLTFGIDVRTITIVLTKWWRKIRFGKEEFVTTLTNLENNSRLALFCNQFNTFYITKCYQSLAKDRKWKDNFYRNCFWGHQLVDWLIQEGLARDDVEAEELGQSLLLGGVISHVAGAHHFHDAPYLYHFVRGHKAPSDDKAVEENQDTV